MPTYKETKSLKFARIVHEIIQYMSLAILGTIIWSLTYICLYFYKELFLCYIKRNIKFEGVSYYEKLKEYNKRKYNILIFNAIIIFFWIIILFTNEEWRNYIIRSGFIIFIFIFIVGWTIYYKYYTYTNDFFDDYVYIFNYIKANTIDRLKNIYSKEKKE